MRSREALTPRAIEVLHSIVEAYIENGGPVASRTISKQRRDSLSPASVRNTMADLADDGYLAQPHTSAGRIPTEKAFRHYVQWLAAGRLPTLEVDQLREKLEHVRSIEESVEYSSHFLTEITRNVGIAAAFPASSQTLDQIELLQLSDRRVLMIVITRDREVRNKIVVLDEEVSQQDLTSIRNYVNCNFGGWVLSDVRHELEIRLAAESAAYDAILRRLHVLYEMGLLDIDTSPELHMEGASNLVGLDLHLTREKMRELFRALEEKKRILDLLDRFLEQPSGELGVQVGLGAAHPSMNSLSLIGLTVILPGGLSAKIAVLGPMRMDYSRVISAVLNVGQTFRALSS